jgi:2-desacetyl-2-hydroxyethyl bacteriochlorophyllide A dehydrogenase
MKVEGVVVHDNRVTVGEVLVDEPDSGQVRLRVEACGICGSDLHLLENGLVADGHTPGHEMCGRIDALGADVSGFSLGQRVAVEPTLGCGSCRYCRAGDPQLCRDLRIYGVHIAGGLAERVLVRAECLHPIDESLAPAVAAMSEPVAVAVHGVRRAGLQNTDRVLVQGAGTVGLVTALVAKSMGAEVWQSARYAHQAELAREMGADRVLHEEEATGLPLRALGNEVDFDVVVETVGGYADTLFDACHAIRPGGTIAVLGMFLGKPSIAPWPMLTKEGTIVWSDCYARHGSGDFADAVRIVESERGRLARLTTHQFSLHDAAAAFAAAVDRRSGAVKITIQPDRSA